MHLLLELPPNHSLGCRREQLQARELAAAAQASWRWQRALPWPGALEPELLHLEFRKTFRYSLWRFGLAPVTALQNRRRALGSPSVGDCFKFRNKIGLDLDLEALCDGLDNSINDLYLQCLAAARASR